MFVFIFIPLSLLSHFDLRPSPPSSFCSSLPTRTTPSKPPRSLSLQIRVLALCSLGFRTPPHWIIPPFLSEAGPAHFPLLPPLAPPLIIILPNRRPWTFPLPPSLLPLSHYLLLGVALCLHFCVSRSVFYLSIYASWTPARFLCFLFFSLSVLFSRPHMHDPPWCGVVWFGLVWYMRTQNYYYL